MAAVFDDRTLAGLTGATWPSATAGTPPPGSSTWRNAQPAYKGVGDRHFALGHNGNLTNTEALGRSERACSRAR